MTSFRWGIIAPGRIAGKFADSLSAIPDAHLQGVASRDRAKAAAFAGKYGGTATAYGSYEELIAADDIDAIYIASPHTLHREHAIACLQAGKPVLCEKPLAVNGAQVDEMIGAARQSDTFLMEAMWTRFLPIMHVVRGWLDDGAIGDARLLHASFGFRCPFNPQHRLLNPDLAGGALLDVGIYPVALAHWVFGGAPRQVLAAAHLGASGVDEQTGMLLHFDGGGLAVLSTAVQTQTEQSARISGTAGEILIHAPFYAATTATLSAGDRRETKTCDHWQNGFEYEVMEVARCLGAGLKESPQMPLAESRSIMASLDAARAAIGLRYPFEQ